MPNGGTLFGVIVRDLPRDMATFNYHIRTSRPRSWTVRHGCSTNSVKYPPGFTLRGYAVRLFCESETRENLLGRIKGLDNTTSREHAPCEKYLANWDYLEVPRTSPEAGCSGKDSYRTRRDMAAPQGPLRARCLKGVHRHRQHDHKPADTPLRPICTSEPCLRTHFCYFRDCRAQQS